MLLPKQPSVSLTWAAKTRTIHGFWPANYIFWGKKCWTPFFYINQIQSQSQWWMWFTCRKPDHVYGLKNYTFPVPGRENRVSEKTDPEPVSIKRHLQRYANVQSVLEIHPDYEWMEAGALKRVSSEPGQLKTVPLYNVFRQTYQFCSSPKQWPHFEWNALANMRNENIRTIQKQCLTGNHNAFSKTLCSGFWMRTAWL